MTRAHIAFALRSLRRSPMFTLLAVAALAIGIGANTAIFSIVNAVLLRPLPYADADALQTVWARWPGQPRGNLSPAEFLDLRDQSQSFASVVGYAPDAVNLSGGDRPERVRIAFATANAFSTLGVSPLLGRTYTSEEDVPGRDAVVVLGEALWRTRFGADPGIIGREIRIDERPMTVLGVMPDGFQMPDHFGSSAAQAWVPLGLDPSYDRSERGWHAISVVARLRPGVTDAAARTETEALGARMRAAYPTEYQDGFGAFTIPVRELVVGDTRLAVLVLAGAVGLVLLVACANVANLLLARAEARQREVAIRTALGASRGELIRQFLTESVVLALGAGALGALAAAWAVGIFAAAAPADIPRAGEVRVDGVVLAFTLLLSTLTGVLFGLVPALHAVGGDVHGVLKEGGRAGSGGKERQHFRRALVGAEVALAVILVVGAGLLIRSFAALRDVDPGFDPTGVLTFQVSLPAARFESNEGVRDFYRQLEQRLAVLPGVNSVGAARRLPMTGDVEIGDWSFVLEGRHSTPPLPSEWQVADWQVVTPDYFKALRIPLRRGRTIEPGDDARVTPIVLVNETTAQRTWPGVDPVGQRILLGGGSADSVWRTVVGVVADVRHRGYDAAPRAEIYVPHAQWPMGTGNPQRTMSIAIRTAGDPELLSNAVRAEVAALDPDLPVAALQTMEQSLGDWAAERRLNLLLLSGFAAVALVLGAVGIYGVMAYTVTRRAGEIGIRMALGASPGEVLRLVMGQGMQPVLIGLVAGSVVALLLARVIRGMLFGVAAADPVTFGVTAAVLVGTAAVAAYVPARRATRVDPSTALRSE